MGQGQQVFNGCVKSNSCHTMSTGTVERTNVKHSNLSNAHGAVKQCKLVEFGKLLCSAASPLFQLHVPGLSQ